MRKNKYTLEDLKTLFDNSDKLALDKDYSLETSIGSTDSLIDTIINNKEYEIKAFNNLKSFCDNDNLFTNKVSTMKANRLNNQIREIKRCCGKKKKISELPLSLEELLFNRDLSNWKRDRYYRILNNAKIPFDESTLFKCYHGKEKHNEHRVFVEKDFEGNTLTILFIDQYHLIADNKKNIEKEFNKYKDCHFCISKL